MDQKKWRERESRCVQEESPGCIAACPVHVDARGLCAAVQQKDYSAGFAILNKSVPFPRIISRICDEPCRKACKRGELDEAISINALEKACIVYGDRPSNSTLTVPPKEKKVAVVGAGLSGLTVAVEIARKGFPVDIFEAKQCLGGRIQDLSESILPREAVEQDLALLTKLPIQINYGVSLGNNDNALLLDVLCVNYDAVYLGIGLQGINVLDLGLEKESTGGLKIDPVSLVTSHPKVFAGGSLRQSNYSGSPIASIADGKIAAISIDRLFQGASLTANRIKEGPYSSNLCTVIDGKAEQPKVQCANALAGYTKDEAVLEANRCWLCQCMECVKVCSFLEKYNGYPKRYLREIYNNLSIVMGIHHANKMINSCNLCGLCGEVCSGNLDMGAICLEARRMMVKKGKMPPSTHDFALRDMKFSTSEKCALNKHQPGFSASQTVFFPGCQLSASAPQNVQKVYQYLCDKLEGGVGLSLGCCGAPAEWAGQEELFQVNLQKIKENWQMQGRPKMVTGCSTCYSILKREIPEMEIETLWAVLERIGLPEQIGPVISPKKLAIHDACTTRHELDLHVSIRRILAQLGHEVEELDGHGTTTKCCGYGGLQVFADRELAGNAADERINESRADYVVYCAMCRNIFAGRGKRVYHLLDLIFNPENDQIAELKGPGYSQRHENRVRLKENLLKRMWGESVEQDQLEVKLIISEPIREMLEERMILDEDIAKVIAYAQQTGNKFKNPQKDSLIASFKPVSVTYWVEYFPREDGFEICNAYSHRIEIME